MPTDARGRRPAEVSLSDDATIPHATRPSPSDATTSHETRPTPSDEAGCMVPEVQLRRALADLDNVRKRAARELARQRAEERAAVVAEWLSVVDDLRLALEHAGKRQDPVIEGLREVYEKAQALLARLGFPPFDDTGQLFDATRHEVVAVTDDTDAPPGTIVATVRPGYGTSEHLLRPAGVVVSHAA